MAFIVLQENSVIKKTYSFLEQQTWDNKLLEKRKLSKISADSCALSQESTHY